MAMAKVLFEVAHPRATWPTEPCERCGVETVVRPDHPGLMVALCAACLTATLAQRAEAA